VLDELTNLVGRYPTRDRLVGQLMLALYRDGRAGDALAVYRAARDRWATQLGLDPSPQLRRLETAILRADPAIAAPPSGGTPVAPVAVADSAVARNLRVVLVDDHPMFRAGMRAALEADPEITVIAEAGDVASAMRVMAQATPDVVVMDLHLPDRSGVEATRQAQLNRLWNLYNHVRDPEAKQELIQQIADVNEQMKAQGCLDITTRTLSSTVTVWTDSSLAPGPYAKDLSIQLRISNTGAVTWSFPTTTLNGGITISQRSGTSASGSYASSGYLSLTAPIAVDTPYGSATGTLSISTDETINTRDGARSGSRVSSPDAKSGSVTMVGTTPLTISVVNLNVQIQVSGTLS
jgi:CheY-like chemotaxis protein